MHTQEVVTTIDDQRFVGSVVFDTSSTERRPGILMVPNWMGPTQGSLDKAKHIAAMGYVVYMADLYGESIRPTNNDEAGKAAGAVRSDRPMMRQRMQHQLSVLKNLAEQTPLDPEHVAAIGFCFGGGCVLELARSGATVNGGVVSFHGNLDTPNPELAAGLKSPIMVLHGADDPLVPPEMVADFWQEMAGAPVNVAFIAYQGAVHSFTNPAAAMKGIAEYHADAAKRSMIAMDQ